MKKSVYILISVILFTNACSQDTIQSKEQSIDLPLDFEKVIANKIPDRIDHLVFYNFNKDEIIIDTNNIRPVVVNFWAVWCHPCVAEIPAFNELMNDYKNCDVDFYAVSYEEDKDNTTEYLKKQSYSFTQLISTREYVESTGYTVGLPTTLFIDKKGNVVYKMAGGSEDPQNQLETIQNFKKGMKMIGCEN